MTMTVKDLEAFADGWNRHDVDFLMTFMAEDCVFETSAGPEAAGKRYVGREQVREGFAGVFRRFPDVHFGNARHFVSGDRGLSEWLFTATSTDGKKIEVTGCDVFTFKGDKIAVKNSYLKNRTSLAGAYPDRPYRFEDCAVEQRNPKRSIWHPSTRSSSQARIRHGSCHRGPADRARAPSALPRRQDAHRQGRRAHEL